MRGLFEKIQEATSYIQSVCSIAPKTAIIAGTGLTNLQNHIENAVKIPYSDIPHFKTSTVKSHSGQLILGHIRNKPVVLMSGRMHYYEGYSMQEVTFPVRVMHSLGADQIFITNASGGINADYQAGDLVILKDHINLMPDNPLRGWNDDRLGDRFPDMMDTYHLPFRTFAKSFCEEKGFGIHEGVYVGFAGPNLETPAEYKFLNMIGGDMVGMSTVPEVLTAKHAQMKIAVISIISNKCFPLEYIQETSVEDVISVVNQNIPKAIDLIEHLIEAFG